MVDSDFFKGKIKEIISQEYEIEFMGDDFDKTIRQISEIKADSIYKWMEDVIKNQIAPIMKNKQNQKYRGVPLSKILSFRKELQINGNEHRIMLIKIKTNGYIEFHLGKHKYYDKLRKNLGLTDKNY